ncbi:MAG: M15 family metallopeptidase [Clostridia bacterium]|nr:M15 family metallopeptidase [Clostridia bacterium]
MSLKRKYRVLFLVLAVCLVLGVVGFVGYHGEWWYPIGLRLRSYPALALHVADPQTSTSTWSIETLTAREDVTLSNNLLLVNASHPLPEGYEAELIEYNGARMHPLMQEPYIALRDDVQAKTNVRIYVASDYRTAEEQAEILASSEEGIAAEIGCSEHEAGLALDVYAPYFGGKNFLRSRAGRMVNEICHEYGYIIRYPLGKEETTGISYEPWHVRYVGAPHATLIMESGLTLEEYIDFLQPGVWYATEGYLISRRASDDLALPDGWITCEISPDNTGYYIVTLKMSM